MDPRSSWGYRKARAEFLSRAVPVCHWCGAAVDDRLPAGAARKATVDHTVEVDRAPGLAMDSRLWVVACWGCNSARGSRYWHDAVVGVERVGLGSTSREW